MIAYIIIFQFFLGKKSKGFSWGAYLELEKAAPAPARLFKEVRSADGF